MEEKKTWSETMKELGKALSNATVENEYKLVCLGVDIQKLKERYFYKDIIAFLKGEKEKCYDFCELKMLYDKYGYEKVNKMLLKTHEETKEENAGEVAENE